MYVLFLFTSDSLLEIIFLITNQKKLIFQQEVFSIMNRSNIDKITIDEMRQLILSNITFSELEKNKGIYEFGNIKGKSIGISFEDMDDESNVYIYNLFIDDEYINIENYGNTKTPLPNNVLYELTDYWNKF